MVNHFPGTGFITNKVDLATSNSKYIPKAFKLPANKKEFLQYASKNKDALFLEKHNQHRGVFLKNVSEIDLSSGESFVQEYVQKPFLVDGHKFDIGVYVVLTSVNPLRVYYYKGDVLFRYCPAKYYPFDPKVLDKYVVGDDYLPTWEVPSLAHPYTALGFTMKEAFDTYVRSKGKDPAVMWAEVERAISEVFLNKEHHIIEALKNYPSGDNFFEMMRFDLVVDEDLKVYLLEANMSPNLSSAHYPPNQLLYEQVLYNLFSLVGVASYMNGRENTDLRGQSQAENMVSAQKNIAVWSDECSTKCRDRCEISPVCGLCRPCLGAKLRKSLFKAHKEFLHKGDFKRLFPPEMVTFLSRTFMEQSQAENMVSAQKNIAVWSDECSTKCRDRCEISPVCGLCRPCLGAKLRKSLLKAHKEFLHKGDFKRLFPPEMVQKQLTTEQFKSLNKMNQQQYLWYQGKCNIDITWCK
ncbi:Tubulin polyglutamylase ttll6 [Papilio xuthus]|uniref:Tubulin polyglutamylase ttll6 n=1 Tax=Papilio xuthus TaxID=66420 RepID=A0A194PCJ8_PAPXU|nr:Tubulin polyglutamylase ttll6 [Papilio xuthus]